MLKSVTNTLATGQVMFKLDSLNSGVCKSIIFQLPFPHYGETHNSVQTKPKIKIITMKDWTSKFVS